jgi:protein SCO1/2
MKQRFGWAGIAGGALVMAVVGYFVFARPSFRGAVINPPIPAPDFTAVDTHGEPFRMSDMRGRVVLLYFGYAHCPDECPLMLAHLNQALETLDARTVGIRVVMVSTDPVRDTPRALAAYLGRFNPAFLGVTGGPSDLAKIYRDYHVVVLDGGETHSSFTYVIDPQGFLRLTFLPDTPPGDIASDLDILLGENFTMPKGEEAQ